MFEMLLGRSVSGKDRLMGFHAPFISMQLIWIGEKPRRVAAEATERDAVASLN
jgi:hypothetical protein